MLIIGIDEVGRGCIAGPVVAAAVVLGETVKGVRDSKKLSAIQRARLVPLIQAASSHYAIGEASVEEIDDINILQATFLAMQRAVKGLGLKPGQALLRIDGNLIPGWAQKKWQAEALVGGDDLEPAIAAASILAKEHRDAYMAVQDTLFPGYSFGKHKGYGTAVHLAAMAQLGITPLHRRTFAPVTRFILAAAPQGPLGS